MALEAGLGGPDCFDETGSWKGIWAFEHGIMCPFKGAAWIVARSKLGPLEIVNEPVGK